jgi:septal ring factor EnvC (AmiA/AmiB activator)
MMRIFLCLLLGAKAADVSPVQKVIELLGENKMKILKDLQSEETEMAAFSEHCDKESSDRTYAIQTATQTIATLEATLEDTAAQIEGLSDDIAKLGSEMASKDADLAKATLIRKTEKTDFDKDESELLKSVDQLERAVVMIKRGTAFVQSGKDKVDPKKAMEATMKVFSEILDANRVNSGMRKMLKNFVQTTDASGEDEYQKLGQPQPTVKNYESSSGGIVGELESMKEKAEETLSDTRTAEMRKQHNFDTFAQSLTDGLKIASDKLADSKKGKAAATEAAGKAKSELVESKESKAADEKFLSQLTADCKETAASWEERQESAHGEMAAINKATEILSEGVRVFMQVGQKNNKGAGDLDTDEKDFDDSADSPAPVDMKRQKVVQKLKQLSSKYGSYALMELAGTAASDPFTKVKGLIEEMIAKLVNEANEEATQEAFCQEEISKSNAAKDEKSMTSDSLSSRISKAAATKALLEQKVKELEGEIAKLDSGMAEATKLRTAEKATNEKAASDFKLASESVEKAIKVLKEYYESAALIQVKATGKQPEFGEAKSDASHAIISILEMSGEDFTKMHMETVTAEADAESGYAQLALDTKVSKAAKSAEVKGSLSEIKSLDVALKNHKEDLDMTQKELSAVMEYLEKLKPQCESKVMSYAEKKSRREAEIEGLKEALTILEGDAVLMQKSVRKHFLN